LRTALQGLATSRTTARPAWWSPAAWGRGARLPIVLACWLGTAGLLTGACGGATSSAVAHTSSTTGKVYGPVPVTTTTLAGGASSAQSKGLAFAACMRSHGVKNFPDSAITTSSKGVELVVPKGINPNSSQFRSAMQSCQDLLSGGANNNGSPSASYTEAVLKFAECMRSQGVKNFPEPNPQTGTFIGGSGIDPNSPVFQAAFAACQKYLPAGAAGG